mmetsp:Transcript_13502/g.19913  ORF Transcript_13502/g.19913 Transcript_13502/m.19913 type:complete len:98 (+) Transcript_13502:104-397(+)
MITFVSYSSAITRSALKRNRDILGHRFLSEASGKSAYGASLWQRLSSFVIGAGLTAFATQFFIMKEVRDGNKLMMLKQKELEVRLAKVEKIEGKRKR